MTAISGCLDKDRFAAYTTLFSHLDPIYDILVENTQPSEEEINTFGVNVRAIKQPLLEILDAQLATPYMHVLCEHSHALTSIQNTSSLSQSGMQHSRHTYPNTTTTGCQSQAYHQQNRLLPCNTTPWWER